MAAALAEHRIEGLRASSAGIEPGGLIAGHAAAVIRERTGASVEDRHAVPLLALRPGDLDLIVAMDHSVATDVRPWAAEVPVMQWDVQDPYGHSLSEYQDTATHIERRLDELRASGSLGPAGSVETG